MLYVFNLINEMLYSPCKCKDVVGLRFNNIIDVIKNSKECTVLVFTDICLEEVAPTCICTRKLACLHMIGCCVGVHSYLIKLIICVGINICHKKWRWVQGKIFIKYWFFGKHSLISYWNEPNVVVKLFMPLYSYAI